MAAEPKTKPTKESVSAYLKKKLKGDRLADGQALVKMMEKASGAKPVMWGTDIIGFDTYPIVYASGDSMDWPVLAFSPRTTAMVLYGTRASPKHAALLKKIGKAKMAGGCLHIKAMADVDTKALDEMLTTAYKAKKAKAKK